MERYYNEGVLKDENFDDSENASRLSCHEGEEENNNGHAMIEDDPLLDDTDMNASGGRHIIKVRGLPWSATHDELILFFDDAKVKGGQDGTHFLLNNQGRPSGEAYVEFETAADVDLALKKDKQYMGKRYVEVYTARAADMEYDMRKSAPRGGSDADKCIVKLRGLPFSCTKEEIHEFFSGLEIAQNGVVLVQDPSGRATGEAFVRFSSCEVATKAMEKHKERIGHRYVEIFPSSVRELDVATGAAPFPPSLFGPPTRGPPGPPYGRYDGYPPGPGYGYGNHHMGRPTPYDRPHPPPPYRGGRMKGGYGDYSGGYNDPPYSPYGDHYGPPHGYSPHAYGSGGYPGRGYDGYSSPGSYRGGGGGYGGYSGGPPSPTGGHRVRMRGLPYSATQQDIYEFFHPMSPLHVHFIYLPNGKFSGEVDAEFRSHEEATDAMRFDRKYIDKRYIELFLYSQPSSRAPPPLDRGERGLPPPASMSHANRSPTAGGYAGGYQTF